MKKLSIITTHPIQYNVPLFMLLSADKTMQLKVFYTWGQAKSKVYDPGFKKEREWDIPLLEGYDYEFLDNTSANPGSHHFCGIINPDIIETISKFNPDAILVFGWAFKSHLQVIRYYSKKTKIIFRGDSTLLNEPSGFSLKKIVRRFFLKWVYRHIDCALYVGTANRKYFIQHGLKEHQLFFAPHAVDNDRFKDANGQYEGQAKQWRRELNIADNTIVFLYAGKFEETKNLKMLLKAFMAVHNDRACLLMVGNGKEEKELKQIAVKDKRIIFLNFQNQKKMPVIYRLSDVFLLPSKGETWGLAVNEAMACGRPVIVSNKCGCAADLVKNGENGFVFNSTSISELTGAMNFFLNNPPKIPVFGRASSDYIQNWSYEFQVKAITSVVACETIKPSLL